MTYKVTKYTLLLMLQLLPVVGVALAGFPQGPRGGGRPHSHYVAAAGTADGASAAASTGSTLVEGSSR